MQNEVEKLMEVEVEMDVTCRITNWTLYKAGTWKQFKTLLWRGWVASTRAPTALLVRLIQTAVSTN